MCTCSMQSFRDKSNDDGQSPAEKQQSYMYPKGPSGGRMGRKVSSGVKGETGDAGSNGAKGNLKLPGVNIDPKQGKSTEDSGYLEKQELGKIPDDENPKSQWRPNHSGGQGAAEKQSQQQNIMHPGDRRGRKDLEVKWIISDTRSIIGRKGNSRLPEDRIKNQRRP